MWSLLSYSLNILKHMLHIPTLYDNVEILGIVYYYHLLLYFILIIV